MILWIQMCFLRLIVRVQLYNWSSRRILTILFWDKPNSRAISCEFLHGYRCAAAVMAFSLVGVRTVRRGPAFASTIALRRFPNCRNTFLSGLLRRRKRSTYSRASVLTWLYRHGQFRSCSAFVVSVFHDQFDRNCSLITRVRELLRQNVAHGWSQWKLCNRLTLSDMCW
jgi:hypothetical protein